MHVITLEGQRITRLAQIKNKPVIVHTTIRNKEAMLRLVVADLYVPKDDPDAWIIQGVGGMEARVDPTMFDHQVTLVSGG
jgi:predicted metal-dependent TIM-barrel fold hydrolase